MLNVSILVSVSVNQSETLINKRLLIARLSNIY